MSIKPSKAIKHSDEEETIPKSKAKQLLVSNESYADSGSASNLNTLTVNQDFKKKFEFNERRKILENAKSKFGKELLSASESSESESEDSSAELINSNVMEKFIKTYVGLKDKNKDILPPPVDDKGYIFNDKDFETTKSKPSKKKEYTVKDAILDYKEDLDDTEKMPDIYDLNYIPQKKKDKLKDGFISAAGDIDEKSKGFSDEGFLTLKKKAEVIPDTKPKEKRITLNDKPLTEMKLQEVIDSAQVEGDSLDILKKYWNDDKCTGKDKFLRNYILTEAWKEKSNDVRVNLLYSKEDEEDSVKSDLFDEYEAGYNFRFQEKGGINITTHTREDGMGMRQKDTKRADKRKEAEDKKKKEKEEKLKELNVARQARKEEYEDKINELLRVAGKSKSSVNDNLIDKLYKILDKDDFNELEFEDAMNKLFDSNYYKGNAIEDNEERLIEDKIIDHKDIDEVLDEQPNPDYDEYMTGQDQENFENIEEDQEQEEQWWYCDSCLKCIKPGKVRYECTKCEDYTLCKSCYQTESHEHVMKKEKVPATCIVSLLILLF